MPTEWDKKTKSTANQKAMSNNSVIDDSNKETNEKRRMEMFVPEKSNRFLDDLIVSSTVKTKIETSLSRIQFHHILYGEWDLKSIDPHGKRTAINLFGPSGTGKTFSAEAIANYLGKTIIRVNYAEIESRYVGETPKNITAAFKQAQETNSVLFFDEADSILGKRLTNVTQSADYGVNVTRSVMLIELDKFDGLVIFATNLAKNYDPAFIRRILAHIEFELPDQECRVRLWKYLLPAKVPIADDINPDWLAEQSEGLAGGDILNVVIASASRAVQRSGDSQKIFRLDVVEAINSIRSAKHKIGATNFDDKQTLVKETFIKPDELSPDARRQYDQIVSGQHQPPNEDLQP